MELKPNLAKAVIAVMKAIKGIDKSLTIGTGQNSYKGVPDQEVKKIIGEAMEKNGLCILPTGVQSKAQVDRWEEESTWNGTTTKKMKQSIFTESITEYLLLHESGESQVLQGLGHGVDSQDKSAGKSTTYALKYTLLYTFLVPTGKIDDADNTHSDDIQAPPVATPAPAPKVIHPELLPGTAKWGKCVEGLATKVATLAKIMEKNTISEVNQALLLKEGKIMEEEIAHKAKGV